MFTLIFTILIVYLGWLVVKPLVAAYMRRSFARRVSNMFGQAFDPTGQGGFGQGAPRRDNAPQRPPRRKIFSREEGEYVEFEEVTVHTSASTSTPPPHNAPHTPREPQVSDAEWEEVK